MNENESFEAIFCYLALNKITLSLPQNFYIQRSILYIDVAKLDEEKEGEVMYDNEQFIIVFGKKGKNRLVNLKDFLPEDIRLKIIQSLLLK